MIYNFQYTDQVNRQSVIDANKDKTLIEEDNIAGGNFLIFTDVKPLDAQVSELQSQNAQMILALVKGGLM